MSKAISIFKKGLFSKHLYKIVCLCACMLIPSALLFYVPKYVSAVLLIWGATILIKDSLSSRSFANASGTVLLMLFILSYTITLVFYTKNQVISTLNVYFWLFVEFFILYSMRETNRNPEQSDMSLRQVNIAASAVALITGVISLVIFFDNLSIVMPDPEGINKYWSIGIVNGRNSGMFNNPIPYSSAMLIGVVASLEVLFSNKSSRKLRVFSVVAILVCFLGIVTSLTRTYYYGLLALLFLTGLIYSLKMLRFKGFSALRALLLSLLIGALVTVAVVGIKQVTQKTLASILDGKRSRIIILNPEKLAGDSKIEESKTTVDNTNGATAEGDESDKTTQSNTLTTPKKTESLTSEIENDIYYDLGLGQKVTLERSEIKRLPSFLYPRDEMWKIALQVIPHSPIFGFTSGNRESSSLEYAKSDYLDSRGKGIVTYHNAYFDIAASAGLLGLALILLFLIYQIIQIARTTWKQYTIGNCAMRAWSYAVCSAYILTHIFFTSMFFGVIVLNNISVCIYFWILMGYIADANETVLENKYDCSIRRLLSIFQKNNLKE